MNRSYDELYNFPDNIRRISKDAMVDSIKNLFSYEKQKIVVVGDVKLLDSLKTLGKVVVLDYKKYL
ncbi:MAG: hypothetical protein U0T83_01715 [Bacteriovoracaceae bacterium]